MEIDSKEFTYQVQDFLVDFAIFVHGIGKKPIYLRSLCREFGISPNTAFIYKVLNILKSHDILKQVPSIGNVKLYNVHKTKLRDLVDELPIVSKISREYNSRYHIRPY